MQRITRKGETAAFIASACAAGRSESETPRILSATPEQLERDYGARDRTAPMADYVSLLFNELDADEVVAAFYNSDHQLAKRAAIFEIKDRYELIEELFIAIRIYWTAKHDAQYGAKSEHLCLYLAEMLQPWSSLKDDWPFVAAIVNHFFFVEPAILALDARAAWTEHLRSLIEKLGGVDSQTFRNYVIKNSAEYVQKGPSEVFELAYKQLVEKLKSEL